MKRIAYISVFFGAFLAQIGFADGVPAIARCGFHGGTQNIELQKTDSESLGRWEAPVSSTIQAVAEVQGGFSMLFYELSLYRAGQQVAKSVAWLPDTLGAKSDTAFGKFSTLSLKYDLEGFNIDCSFHLAPARAAIDWP